MNKAVIDIAKLQRSCNACALSQLCLPANLGHEGLLRLDTLISSSQPIDAKHLLFADGAPFHHLYVVRSGSLKTVSYDSDGSEVVLGFHIPGDVIGFDGVSTMHHQCTAIALERSSLCNVPFSTLDDTARQVPSLQQQLYRLISREFILDQQHMAMMGRKQAHERLAIFLKRLSDRRRAVKQDPMLLTLSMTRYDIASYLGVVFETASRLFSRLRNDGLIEVDGRNVRILDYEALKRVAEGTGDDPSERRRVG